MRKSRLILTFSILIVLFCFFIFDSPIFHFSSIEVVFLKSDNENLLNLSQSKSIDVIAIKTKTDALVKDDYGKSIFLIKKEHLAVECHCNVSFTYFIMISTKI